MNLVENGQEQRMGLGPLLLISLLAVLLGIVVMMVLSGTASAACTPPGSGDWVVQNSEICTPTGTLTVNGDLIIESGGNLTLVGTTVQMNGAFDGQRTIDVQNGGILNVQSSSLITASNTNFEYKFLVRGGATVLMSQSTVRECGFDLSDDENLGMRVESNLVTITQSTFNDNFVGVYVKGVVITIDNSTFYDNTYGVMVGSSSDGLACRAATARRRYVAPRSDIRVAARRENVSLASRQKWPTPSGPTRRGDSFSPALPSATAPGAPPANAADTAPETRSYIPRSSWNRTSRF